MATAREVVQQVTAQVDKVRDELTSKLDELEAKINDGTVAVSDLDALRAAVQGVDDLVPDAEPEAPADVPVEEAPVDEEPVAE